MKHDEIIYARLPRTLRNELERERARMSAAAGEKMKTSAVIRAVLERGLRSRRRAKAQSRRAA